jgi:hypothetical protein
MSFYREKPVKAVRKARRCIACGRMIGVGSPALDASGHFNGEFWAATYHAECRAAEIALNSLPLLHYEEWMALSDIEWDDWDWLLAEHPIVAARMGITAEKLQAVKDRQSQMWGPRK